MLQIVLGNDHPVPKDRIKYLPPNVYCAMNHDGGNNNNTKTNQDPKGVSIEYRARLARPENQAGIFLFSDQKSTNNTGSGGNKKSYAAAASASSNNASLSSSSSSSSLLANGARTEFFLQWNLTRCLPFLRRPVTVIVEMFEVFERDDFKVPAELKATSNNKKDASNGKNDNDDDDEGSSSKSKTAATQQPTPKNKVTLVVPGMITNTNTKDTIWIGKFDFRERIKKEASSNNNNNRRFFRLSFVRMIIGSHMLISADKKTFTVVVPMPNIFNNNNTVQNDNNNKKIKITKNKNKNDDDNENSGEDDDEGNSFAGTTTAVIETVSLLSDATIAPADLTDEQKRRLATATNNLEFHLRNAVLIKGASQEKRQQVEMVAHLDVQRQTEEERKLRAGKTQVSKLQEARRKRSKLTNYGSFLCTAPIEKDEAMDLAEKMKNATTPKEGIDLVLEFNMKSVDKSSSGGQQLPKFLSDSAFIWFLFFAVAVGLIAVIWNAISKSHINSTISVPKSSRKSSSSSSSKPSSNKKASKRVEEEDL